MRGSHLIAFLVVLWLAGPSPAQPAPDSGLEERIRQADALQEKGSLSEARSLYESVLPALKAGGQSSRLGYVYNALSEIASSDGNYDEAIKLADQAADAYARVGDQQGKSHALNYRGIAEVQRGFYPAAQATLTQALALSRNTGDLESQVRILNNLGTADYYPGNYLRAFRSYEEALAIVARNERLPWSAYWRQITEINRATVYQRLGRFQPALEIYQNIESSSKNLTASDRAHLLTNLGALYRRLGDPWKALDRYRAALALYTRQRDADGEISTLKNIGIVYALDQNNPGPARQFFERALRRATEAHNQREEMQGHLYLGETFLRNGQAAASNKEFAQALLQARRLNTPEEQWKALYGCGQTEEQLGDAAKAEADYREAISIIEASRAHLQLSALRAEFLADKRDVFDALIALLLQKNDIAGAFLFLEKSRARAFQDRIQSSNSLHQASATLDEIQRLLDDSTILLEFWTSKGRVALIWCRRDAYGVEQSQLSSGELRRALTFLQRLPGNLHDDWRQEVKVLTRLFPRGLPLAAKTTRAFIVPDGWLSSLPFDLVPTGGQSEQVLIERLNIAYLPTAALLRRLNKAAVTIRFPWDRELVAFGAPVIRGDGKADELESESAIQSLPYSAEEIRNIAALSEGENRLFLGKDDVKTAFLTDTVRSAPVLHVSTHAFADADNPEDSRMVFSPANSGASPDYIFLREIHGLDLSGVDLATLSACSTERGRMIRGEGIQAFGRALLSAGSRSALTTLWHVDDQPTMEFMKQFYYFALERHESKAEALRAAKLKFLHSGTELANPAHWAGFVLSGDGFHPLPVFISWQQIAAGLAVLVFLAASSWWMASGRRRRLHGVDRA